MHLYPPTTSNGKRAGGFATWRKDGHARRRSNQGRPFVVRFQFPDGYHVAPHTHPKTERVTVISGALYLATGEALDRNSKKRLPVGSFGYWPAGMKHTAWAEGETIIQLHGIGPWQINYVNPADDRETRRNNACQHSRVVTISPTRAGWRADIEINCANSYSPTPNVSANSRAFSRKSFGCAFHVFLLAHSGRAFW